MARAADQVHRRAQVRLAEVTAARLKAVLERLPDPTGQEAMDDYNRAAVPIVAGGQTRAAQVAVGYIATLAAPTRTPSVARAVRGVLVDKDAPVARSPVLRLWKLVEEGSAIADAVTAAGSYAEALASNDLQAAQHAGLEEGASSAGQRIVGWMKELDPECCDWCRLVGEERVYYRADTVSSHERDKCSVRPVFEGEEE